LDLVEPQFAAELDPLTGLEPGDDLSLGLEVREQLLRGRDRFPVEDPAGRLLDALNQQGQQGSIRWARRRAAGLVLRARTSGNAGNSTTGTPAGGKAGATVTDSVININQVISSSTGLVGGIHALNSAAWDIANSLV